MKLITHRGTQEIGGSCVELKTRNNRILVDFGLPLVSSQKDQPFDSKILEGKSVEELKRDTDKCIKKILKAISQD